jgi:hypothetical protein
LKGNFEMTICRRIHAIVAVATISTATLIYAQQTPYVVGSDITGRVFCTDTNAPARFAKVVLRPIEGDHTGEDFMKNLMNNIQKMAAKGDDAKPAKGDGAKPAEPLDSDKQKALAESEKGFSQAMEMVNASTVGLNGEFKFVGVKAGTYYVHAIYAGYRDALDQFTDEDFASSDPAMKARIAQLPMVTVTGTNSAHAELRLERGAAISGVIQYEDGTPAAGWIVTAIKPGSVDSATEAANNRMNAALAMSGAVQLAKADDRGHFRIAGLTPGDYALRAELSAPSIGVTAKNIGDGGSGISLAVYSGNTFTRADAKPVRVTTSEEYSSVQMMVPIHLLHSIVGHVVAKSDGHMLNSGDVKLTTKSNPALQQKAAIRDDGTFHFEYLPTGITYTLTVEDAADGRHSPPTGPGFLGIHLPNTEILHKYGSDSTDVMLGDQDIDSVRLTVAQTDWKPSPTKGNKPDADLGDLFKGIFDAASPAKDEKK